MDKEIQNPQVEEKKEKGAGMVEYALLVSLIGVALIAALNLLKDNINSSFSNASTALTN